LPKITIITIFFALWPTFLFVINRRFRFFEQNLDLWTKIRFVTKITLFVQNFDFWTKFQFLTKFSIFHKNFNSFLKFPKKYILATLPTNGVRLDFRTPFMGAESSAKVYVKLLFLAYVFLFIFWHFLNFVHIISDSNECQNQNLSNFEAPGIFSQRDFCLKIIVYIKYQNFLFKI